MLLTNYSYQNCLEQRVYFYVCLKINIFSNDEESVSLTGTSKANVREIGSFCRYRKALYFRSLGIGLYLEFFCFLSFVTFVLRNLCSEYTPVLTEEAEK